ncbi:MAG: hypothetical protein J0H40_17690 [Rhizobiales bacterium]|nr:hypothetical protein [Hyphomicrobiales bacterium]
MAALLKLPDYLEQVSKQKWKPGVLDCGTFMAGWVEQLTGIDPIADVRGSYASERQFMRIVRREGGLEASCRSRLERVGATETAHPEAGDILLVMAPYAVRKGHVQSRPTGAIAVSAFKTAVVTSDMGIVIAGTNRLPTLRAWTFR